MSFSCDWKALVAASSGYLPLDPRVRRAIRVLLWCKFLNGQTATCDPKALALEATGIWSCVTPDQFDAIETMFTCLFVNSGGGGGGATQVFSGNYGGGEPTQTPTTSAAIAYDLDSPFTMWTWSGSSWL